MPSFLPLFILSFVLCGLNVTNGKIVQERFISRSRSPRLFPFIIPPYQFTNVVEAPCTTATNTEGTCTTRARCLAGGGAANGLCGRNNRGVCCVNERTCGTTTSARVTYFYNPGYTGTFNGGGQCRLSISRQNQNVCQLRIDFQSLELAPPSYNADAPYGTCSADFLSLSDLRLPSICGSNSGQHVYVDFNPGSSLHQLIIDTDGATSLERQWNLKITQISCNDTNRAPSGCLMYFNETSRTVSSFNYASAPPTVNQSLNWTRQINNLNYGICIKPAPGYCSISWRSEVEGFSLSNTTDCRSSFVIIPQSPTANGNATDRLCGQAFPSEINTMAMPFVLYVNTDFNSTIANHTRGFQLSYRQVLC